MPVTMVLFLVFLLIILQIYNSTLILENIDISWSDAIQYDVYLKIKY